MQVAANGSDGHQRPDLAEGGCLWLTNDHQKKLHLIFLFFYEITTSNLYYL